MVFRRHDTQVEENPIVDFSAACMDHGDGRYDPSLLPEQMPNFLYGLLAPAWAANNQLIPINQSMAAKLRAQLFDNRDYVTDQRAFQELSVRTTRAPMRKERLKKLIIDTINGMPYSEEPPLFTQVVDEAVGTPALMRPTEELVESIYRHAFGWGPLEPLMDEADKTITEIMVDGFDKIFTERTIAGRDARMVREATHFESPEVYGAYVRAMVETMAETVDRQNPTVDFSLPDGSRVNVTIPPITPEPVVTIRRKSEELYTLDTLRDFGSFTPEMQDFLHEANLAGANLITFGPTGSGKTTLLSALLHDKPASARLVIVEDTREITIDPRKHDNVVSGLVDEPNRNMRDLVRNALRQRPDHLIVGETRDATAYDLMQAFNTGQLGSMSTIHASSPEGALVRLTNLVRQEPSAPGEEPARRMVAEGIHLLVWATRLRNGKRLIYSIDEVDGVDDQYKFVHRNIFRVYHRRNAEGEQQTIFGHNPDYVMGAELAELFRRRGFDPNRWTGERARNEGKRAAGEEEA